MAKEGTYALGFVVYFRRNHPSHTTIITGAYPATHGIYYNSPLNQMVKQDVGIGKWFN
jgi:arylsulfatase A-like enzyme